MPGDKVLVVDNDGYFMGVSIAEKLALEGKQVTLMTHLGHIGPYMHFTLEAPNMHRKLHKLDVEIVTYHIPTQIEEGHVKSVHVYDEEAHEHDWECRLGRPRDAAALERGAVPLAQGRHRPRDAERRGRRRASTGSATARRRA